MTRYVPASRAWDLSVALLALSRPHSIRLPGEVTAAAYAVVKDLKGDSWLLLDDEREVFVHPAAELGEIAPILQPLMDAGFLPANTIDLLQGALDEHRGGRLVVWSVIPAEIKAESKTKAWMIEDERLNPEPGGMM